MKKRILVVEDDKSLREGLALSLSSEALEVKTAASLKEAQEALNNGGLDLIVLDNQLPDGTGMDFCRSLRQASAIPVIFLTVCDSEMDTVAAFRMGADDYVTKPFSLMILRERIGAALKRTGTGEVIYRQGRFDFNFTELSYSVDGQKVFLSAAEQKILRILVDSRNCIVPREQMIEKVWSCDGEFIDDNALTVSIKRLRGKVGSHAIKTVYGLGYVWAGGDEA